MNWGSIIAGAMEGGAKAAYQIADDNEKRANRLADFEMERAARREDKLFEIEQAQKAADEKLARYVKDYERVQVRAEEIDRGRAAAKLTTVNPNNELSAAEYEQMMAENPQYRQIYEQAGYIPQQKQSGIVADQMQAAREIGAVPEVRKDLQESYTRTVQAERDADRAAREERRDTQRDRQLDQGDRRIEALINGKDGKGGNSNPTREALQYLDGQRKRIKDSLTELRQLEKADLEGVYDQKKRAEIKQQYATRRSELEAEDKALSKDYERMRGRLFDDGPAPTPAPAPAPNGQRAPSDPKLGKKPDWQTDQSYNDQVKILRDEYDKAVRDKRTEDASAIARELKRIGVDVNAVNGDNRSGGLPAPKSQADFAALPKGTRYQAPDGTIRIKQ